MKDNFLIIFASLLLISGWFYIFRSGYINTQPAAIPPPVITAIPTSQIIQTPKATSTPEPVTVFTPTPTPISTIPSINIRGGEGFDN